LEVKYLLHLKKTEIAAEGGVVREFRIFYQYRIIELGALINKEVKEEVKYINQGTISYLVEGGG